MYNDRYNRYGGYQGYRNYIGNGWTRHEVFETILREHPPKTEYTPGDYVVLMVRFNLDGGTYCYLSDDDIYDPGDLVTVKVRGEEKAVEVVSVGYYSPDDYPFENVHVRRVMGPAYGDLASKYEEAIREEKEREADNEEVRAEAKAILEEARMAKSEAYRDRAEAKKVRDEAELEKNRAAEERQAAEQVRAEAQKRLSEAERILEEAKAVTASTEQTIVKTKEEGERQRAAYARLEEERREAAKVWKRERPGTDEQMILGLRAVQDALDEDEEIYNGMSRLEELMTKVIRRVDDLQEERPAAVRDVSDRLYGFYLPKTIDVLEQYRNIFSSGLPPKNVDGLRRDVIKVINESVEVYGNILSELYASDMLNLSAELEALRMMFEFEGLTDPEFEIG